MRRLIVIAILLGGCQSVPLSPYRVDVQQGNYVTQEMVAKLKPGMTRAQVRYTLGAPLIVDPFRTDRWDYVYVFQKAGRLTEHRRVTVLFDGDKLVRVEGDVVPQTVPAATVKPDAGPTPPAMAKPEAGATPSPAVEQSTPASSQKDGTAAQEPTAEKGFFGRMLEKLGW
jgi:outer membrane protein assembly factor BamE